MMKKPFNKYIYQHCNTDQLKVVIARSEHYALRQNFGNLGGYKFVQSQQLNK